MSKRVRSERGFTLVELLVVLAILAILIAVVVPNLSGLTGGAKARAAQAELDIVQTAFDTMIADDEAVTIAANAVARQVAVDDAMTIWVVLSYDPATGLETTGPTSGTVRLRSVSHGYYTWTNNGRVAQVTYD